MLLFEFKNYPDRVGLNLIIGPGPIEIRKSLFELTHTDKLFKPSLKMLGKSFNTIYQFNILTSKAYAEADLDDLESEIKKKWNQFLEGDFLKIRQIVENQDWIWAK
jgi:hypothetical protein